MADLKTFAEQLVNLTVKEVNELAKILKDDYGIEPAAAAPVMAAGGGGAAAAASITDCVFEMQRPTTVDEVNGLLKADAAGPLKGILGYEERPLVSIDYCGDPRSSIVDAAHTLVTDGTLVKIYAWYDNEWGYVNRYVELARKVAASLRTGFPKWCLFCRRPQPAGDGLQGSDIPMEEQHE